MTIEWDIEELVGYAVGMSEDDTEKMINNSTVDEVLDEAYEVDLNTYTKIVKDLLPLTPQIKAGVSGDIYNAFIDVKNKRMIVKAKALI